MEYNKAINPKSGPDGVFVAAIMPSRAPKIKNVVTRSHKDSSVGGATDLHSQTVFIPTADNAYDRTIRYHEALHAAHSDEKRVLKDLLDQALEDARLHRHCSKASSSEFQRARRDELVVALRDLRIAKRQPVVTASTSLVVLRAMAILTAGKHSARSQRLLESVLARFGKDAQANFSKALRLIANPSNWNAARKAIKEYFKSRYESNTPAPQITAPKKTQSQGDKPQKPQEQQFAPPPDLIDEDEEKPETQDSDNSEESEGESEDEKSGGSNSNDSKSESEDEESEDEESEDSKSKGGSDSDSDESDEDEDGEDSKSGDSDEDEDADGESDGAEQSDEDGEADEVNDADNSEDGSYDYDIVPAESQSVTKPRKDSDPDLYTADLTPLMDKKQFDSMTSRYPMKIYIRRLDMGINRVKLPMGRRSPLPVTSGRKILARRLAGAMSNPSSHVFARQVSQGGYGTILIDASGSMAIPVPVLVKFLEKAPALTLAFYNAPDDRDETAKGNIFIFAANGYRAGSHAINGEEIEHYGCGNLIDYHAMAWLLKQPAPHYIVTDCGWTGAWSWSSETLCRKLQASKDLIVVPDLAAMEKILEDLDRGRKQGKL